MLCVCPCAAADHRHYYDLYQPGQEHLPSGGDPGQRPQGGGRGRYLGSLSDQRDLCRFADSHGRRRRKVPDRDPVHRRLQHGASLRQRSYLSAAVLRQGGHRHPCCPQRGYRDLQEGRQPLHHRSGSGKNEAPPGGDHAGHQRYRHGGGRFYRQLFCPCAGDPDQLSLHGYHRQHGAPGACGALQLPQHGPDQDRRLQHGAAFHV